MKKFLYSRSMLCILAALLVFTFFLPDLAGPVPSLIIGGSIIAFAIYIYNLWSRVDSDPRSKDPNHDHESHES